MSRRPRITTPQRRRRLVTRHHLARTAPGVEAAVADVVALHSSDPATPYVALWARVPDVTVADVEDALYDRRSLWRLHSIRRTIWVVPREAGAMMLGAAAVALATKDRRSLERFITASEVHPDPAGWLDELAELVLAVLDGAQPMATRDLGEALPELTTKITVGTGRYTQQQSVSSRLLYQMAMEGRIVRARPLGSWRASQYRWARVEQWFDEPIERLRPQPAVAARADLVTAYLRAFGPVTLDDVRWWTGWTKRQSTTALEAVGAEAVDLDHGVEGWIAPGDLDLGDEPDGPVIALLPSLDPTAMGWTDRSWYVGEHTTFGGPLFDRNGNVGPTVWLDGRVVGGWSQRTDGEVVTGLLEDVGATAGAMIEARAADLRGWLGDHVVIPRFPTPLQKELSGG